MTVRDKLSALLDDRHPSDMVLLYYSGHGIVDRANSLFLCTGDTRADRPRARSLPASEIREMMEQSRAGKVVVVLDCCHSGVFTEGIKGRNDTAVNSATFDPGEGAEGHYVLTATNSIQYALDAGPISGDGSVGRTPLSHFTSWLVDGIGRAEAAPDKSYITLDDLYTYLCRRARQSGAAMTPQRYVKRNSGEMIIARNPAAKPPSIPAELLAEFDDPSWITRFEAVAKLKDVVSRRPALLNAARKLLRDRMANERDRDVHETMTAAFIELRVMADAQTDGLDQRKKSAAQGLASVPDQSPQNVKKQEASSNALDARQAQSGTRQPEECATERKPHSEQLEAREDKSRKDKEPREEGTRDVDAARGKLILRMLGCCLCFAAIIGGALTFRRSDDGAVWGHLFTSFASPILVSRFIRRSDLGVVIATALSLGAPMAVSVMSGRAFDIGMALIISFCCSVITYFAIVFARGLSGR
ncbi:hypothetical protein A9R05_40135 (plasmid) [Burkholderia sp. KK1]|nr:hypothetical protein A9R05_40135 [Burkholderia sp. KK1]